MSTPDKKTKGRQKIDMKKITNDKHLAVTFSKRHSGILTKAHELSILCGVQLAVIMLSPTKKPITYGHPSVEEIINNYLDQLPPPNPSTSRHMEAYHNANTQELNAAFANMIAEIQVEKKTREELEVIKKARQERIWSDAPIPTLEAQKLEVLKRLMLELKNIAKNQAEGLAVEAATASTPIVPGFGSSGANGVGPSK